uniref:HXXEE domain-containing protein n=1 Tax=Angiostrongylus cantonensis TaxID=6313 RepID=A0A0K0D307_ANGCA
MLSVSRYKRLQNIYNKHTLLYEISRYCYFYAGLGELLFLSALSIVGERENIQLHVIFFYTFGFCGVVHMISNIFCHAHSLYYLNPYGRIGYYLKIISASLYIMSAPILVGSFILYWKRCLTWGK